jgi:hypothetical protein
MDKMTPELKKLADTLRSSGLAASATEAIRMATDIDSTGRKSHAHFLEESKKIENALERKYLVEEPKINVQVTRTAEVKRNLGRDWELMGSNEQSVNNEDHGVMKRVETTTIIKPIHETERSMNPVEHIAEPLPVMESSPTISTPQQMGDEEELFKEDSDFSYGNSGNKEESQAFSLASNVPSEPSIVFEEPKPAFEEQPAFVQEYQNEAVVEKTQEVNETDSKPSSEMEEPTIDLGSIFNFSKN